MKKTNELNINHYVELAKSKVGLVGDLEFQSRRDGFAGHYEILEFEEHEEPHFNFSVWWLEEDDTPNGAKVGYYIIKLTDTKFYNNKTIKCEVHAYVQDDEGLREDLYISTKNEYTGKYLKAYTFPIIDFMKRV